MTALSEHQRPRTLTEALRGMSAEQLTTLLELRLDLVDPVPHDIAELASRSTTSSSIAQAIDELNVWLRTVAEALSALPDPASAAELVIMLGQPQPTVAAAVAPDRRVSGETVLTDVRVIAIDQALMQGAVEGQESTRQARTVTLEVTPK